MRCFGDEDPLYARYHDEEWGVAVHDEQTLFEMLILEGAQAGLSWLTILKRRAGYRRAFHHFDPKRVAAMRDEELEKLCKDKSIIRHRGKIFAARQNARLFLDIQRECGSFDRYLWGDEPPVINRWKTREEVPVKNARSDALARDLKRRGMAFVGSTIIYAYLQAVGVVNDHLDGCLVWQSGVE